MTKRMYFYRINHQEIKILYPTSPVKMHCAQGHSLHGQIEDLPKDPKFITLKRKMLE